MIGACSPSLPDWREVLHPCAPNMFPSPAASILTLSSWRFKCFTYRSVISGCGYVQELLAVLGQGLIQFRLFTWPVDSPQSSFPVSMNKPGGRDTVFVCQWCPSHRLNSSPTKIKMKVWKCSAHHWEWREQGGQGVETSRGLGIFVQAWIGKGDVMT